MDLITFATPPQIVPAYQGLPPLPEDIWRAWNWQPLALLGFGLMALAYIRGVWILWVRVGIGRGIRYWQVAAFGGGWLALFIALISPLSAFGTALFSAHMLQHMILIVIAAPLLILGGPIVPFLWALPKPMRHAVGRWWRETKVVRAAWHGLTHPLVIWSLYGATLWIWHLPSLYQTTLEQVLVHELEHASFFGMALLFWWVVIHQSGHRRFGYGAGIFFVFTTALHSGLLGALITFAKIPLYPIYTSSVAAWNLTILED